MHHIFYDLVVAVLLLISLWQGYRKGFVLTLCGFLAIFVAFIGATIASDVLAAPVAEVIRPVIENSIQEFVNSRVSVSAPPEAVGTGIVLPLDSLLRFLKASGVYEGFVTTFQSSVDAGIIQITDNALGAFADYVALQLAETVLFLVAFITLLVVWYFISHALDLAFRLPVLSALNHWAGALLGLAKGCVLLYIAAQLLKGGFLPPDVVEETCLLRFFCTVDPLALFAAISQ